MMTTTTINPVFTSGDTVKRTTTSFTQPTPSGTMNVAITNRTTGQTYLVISTTGGKTILAPTDKIQNPESFITEPTWISEQTLKHI